ncbi:hypothetical protein [Arthrobacter pigmenti]
MAGGYATEHHELDSGRPPAETGRLIQNLAEELGWRVKDPQASSWVAEKGSNLRLRLFGAWLPGGRGNIAIGMTITLEANDNGQSIQIEAYDRLGWWLDRYLEPDTHFKRLVRHVLTEQVGRYVRRLEEELP